MNGIPASLRFCLTIIACLLITGALAAQDEGPLPKGARLKGKVGPRTVSIGDPELSPRELDLSRLEIDPEVQETFLEQVRRPLDEEELEMLRQQRIERMQRKLGTTLSEASLIREDFFIERKQARRAARKQREEMEEGGNDWIAIGLAALFCGYVVLELRK